MRQCAVMVWFSCVGMLILGHPAARADVTPDAAIEIHVQSVTGSCETSIANCDEVDNSSEALGPLEFLFFFQPIYWQQVQQPVRLSSLHTELIWPASWQLLDVDGCSASWSTLGETGEAHTLDMEWWDCPELPVESGGVFLLARFVFDAAEPGQLREATDFASTVLLGCPPNTVDVHPVLCFGEVGVDCEYTRFHCGYLPPCLPYFLDESLQLNAPPGGIAVATTEVTGIDLCWNHLVFDAEASWLEVEAELMDNYNAELTVTADAAGLPPGLYTTQLRAFTSTIARCLPVEFHVGTATDVPESPGAQPLSWSRVKSLYP